MLLWNSPAETEGVILLRLSVVVHLFPITQAPFWLITLDSNFSLWCWLDLINDCRQDGGSLPCCSHFQTPINTQSYPESNFWCLFFFFLSCLSYFKFFAHFVTLGDVITESVVLLKNLKKKLFLSIYFLGWPFWPWLFRSFKYFSRSMPLNIRLLEGREIWWECLTSEHRAARCSGANHLDYLINRVKMFLIIDYFKPPCKWSNS